MLISIFIILDHDKVNFLSPPGLLAPRSFLWANMRTPLVVLLFSYGISHGLGFVQPSTAVLLQQRRRSSRCFLFSPGDDNGPIVTTSKPKSGAPAGRKVSREPGGGWGSWEKVVSQRVEQDSVLKKLQPPAGLQVRTIAKGDMMGVSRLCIDTFRGPFQWFELPVQLFQEFAFFGQIQGRLGRVTRNEIKHSMVVVEDTNGFGPGRRGKVVGFLEIGMLPKPSSSEESALAGEALTAARAAAALAAATAAAGKKGRGKKEEGRPPSSPTTSLDAGSGTAAVAAEEEEEEKEGRGGAGDGTTAIKKERAPDVAYLANVVVDRKQRRRGIGRTMVSSAVEIVSELWPSEESIYVSVEQGNDVALALYQGMGFELAALEDEMVARSRRRPPRIYMSKPLRE